MIGVFQPTHIRPKFLERLRVSGIFLPPSLFESHNGSELGRGRSVMNLIILIVFPGAFSVVALLMIASGTGATQQTKKMLATLDSALGHQLDEFDRSDCRSAQAGTAERRTLDQSLADEDRTWRRVCACCSIRPICRWTAGGLILMSVAAFVIPAYLRLSAKRITRSFRWRLGWC